MNPNDPQYQIAAGIFNDLSEHLTQWCPQSDLDALDEVAAQYGTNSTEYKEKLKEVLLANLDQANEWVEEHAHVEYTQESAFTQPTDSTQGTDGTNGAGGAGDTSSTENTVPEYNKDSVIENAGLLTIYAEGSWKGDKVSWKNDAGKDTDKCREMARTNGIEYAKQLLNDLEAALTAQLGDQCTEEIKSYIQKAKTTVLTDTGSWLDTDWDHAMLGKNRGFVIFIVVII